MRFAIYYVLYVARAVVWGFFGFVLVVWLIERFCLRSRTNGIK